MFRKSLEEAGMPEDDLSNMKIEKPKVSDHHRKTKRKGFPCETSRTSATT